MVEQEKEKQKKKHKISNMEWGFVIGLLGLIDLTQMLFDFIALVPPFFGLAIVPILIDVLVGLSWPTYLRFRGISVTTPRIIIFLIGLLFESIPGFNGLPFWCLDGLAMMASIKAEEKLTQSKIGQTALKVAAVAAAPETGGGSLIAEKALTSEADAVAQTSGEQPETATPEEDDAEGRDDNNDEDDDTPESTEPPTEQKVSENSKKPKPIDASPSKKPFSSPVPKRNQLDLRGDISSSTNRTQKERDDLLDYNKTPEQRKRERQNRPNVLEKTLDWTQNTDK